MATINNTIAILISLVLIILIFQLNIHDCLPQFNGKEYPLRLQPELDILDVESYLRNPRLINLQIKCILFDGPCDAVGRWAKPRVKAGLLGECLMCTEKQKGLLNTWLEKLIIHNPDLYRAGVAKFITNSGIQIPKEELDNIARSIEAGVVILNSNFSSSTLTSK